MPPGDGARHGRDGLLGVAAWLVLFAGLAWILHAALSYFPEGWRWVNRDRGVGVEWTLRQALSLTIALPGSLYLLGRFFEWRRRVLGEPGPSGAGRDGAVAGEGPAGELGCGAILLVLLGATGLLRPAALLLFPRAGLDPDGDGVLPFALWGALVFGLLVLGRLGVRVLGRRRWTRGVPPRREPSGPRP